MTVSGKTRRLMFGGSSFADFIWLRPLLAAMYHRRCCTAQLAVAAVVVIVDHEVLQQLAQVIQSANDWNASEPFLFQGQDNPLGDGDGAVSADRPGSLLHVPSGEQVSKRVRGEDLILVASEMPGSAVLSEGVFHRAHDPTRVRSFQGDGGHNRAGEVIYSYQYPNRPDSPAQHTSAIHTPHVVRVAGYDLPRDRGLCFDLRYSEPSPRRLWLHQHVPDCRGGDEHAQQLEDVGDPLATEHWLGLKDVPGEFGRRLPRARSRPFSRPGHSARQHAANDRMLTGRSGSARSPCFGECRSRPYARVSGVAPSGCGVSERGRSSRHHLRALFPAAVPDIIGGDVSQRPVVALAVVVVHEPADGGPELIGTGMHEQRDLVLQRPVHPLDLAVGPRMRARARMCSSSCVRKKPSITRET